MQSRVDQFTDAFSRWLQAEGVHDVTAYKNESDRVMEYSITYEDYGYIHCVNILDIECSTDWKYAHRQAMLVLDILTKGDSDNEKKAIL